MMQQDANAGRNVIDFLEYQQSRKAPALSARSCRHCGAALLDGESDDDCSSIDGTIEAAKPRRYYAE